MRRAATSRNSRIDGACAGVGNDELVAYKRTGVDCAKVRICRTCFVDHAAVRDWPRKGQCVGGKVSLNGRIGAAADPQHIGIRARCRATDADADTVTDCGAV